ncbi:hypothetical protein LXA43DRAFT_1100908 [Ganoderma leucocontextum]|nr:hypothetical protein LXA43DRAFT_1100908 [Ganoderma leucocontextum]
MDPTTTASEEAALTHAVTTTLGALLIGTFFALMLYGLVLHQAYGYFRMYGADPLWLKILVVTALVLETVVSVLNMDACYDYLVTNFSNTNLERPAPYSIKLLALFPASVALTVQIFFARRVWLVGKKYRIIVFISILFMLVELALPLSAVILAFEAKTLADALRFSYLVSARNAAATVTDVLLTTILVYSLHKSRTGIKSTDSMINVLIMYAVNTGLLTSVFNILCLVFVSAPVTFCFDPAPIQISKGFVFPQSFTYAAVDLVSSRLYASSLLAALNSRKVVLDIGSSNSGADDGPFGTVIVPSRQPLAHNDPVVVRSEQWELRSKASPSRVQLTSLMALTRGAWTTDEDDGELSSGGGPAV